MSNNLRIVLAQLNLCVGDISGNLSKLIENAERARDEMATDLIIFPELSITGYPPEDLLLRKSFITAATNALEDFKTRVKDIYCIVGHPYATEQKLFNSCSLIYNGQILSRYDKQCLPNYGVFDEYRYFTPGLSPQVINIKGHPIGMIICEDLWKVSPIKKTVDAGARLIIVLNASPFELNKHEERHAILANQAKDFHVPIAYVNQLGKQDEIVFDGGSMVVDSNGDICQFAGICHEKLLMSDIEFLPSKTTILKKSFSLPSEEQRIYDCLVLGVRDYLSKNNFPGALIGVSGGIDSALTLAIAVDALGHENVEAILMPSRYTSEMSMEDGLALVENLNVNHQIISIEPAFQVFLNSLAASFAEKAVDLTEENIQARCRGVILMALSNKTGKIVLTTGNRSELAVGYATLYGDMCGGLAVLKDVPKTMVYRLSHYRNQISAVIPQRIIDRPPTAELAPNQKDEDSLPPYPVLDEILHYYLNQEKSTQEIIAMGFEEAIVKKVARMIKRNEYKRRQSAIGIRINHNTFVRDRRYPITSKFND